MRITRNLFVLLNRLDFSLREKPTSEVVAKVLADLSDYTDYHFNREEILMETCEYPQIDKHKRVHRVLRAQVAKYGRPSSGIPQPWVHE